jgi:hypothetical protein
MRPGRVAPPFEREHADHKCLLGLSLTAPLAVLVLLGMGLTSLVGFGLVQRMLHCSNPAETGEALAGWPSSGKLNQPSISRPQDPGGVEQVFHLMRQPFDA